MQQTQLLSNPPSCSETYAAQWKAQREAHAGLRAILEVIEKPQGLALLFAHDDPDGITSGLIMKRVMQKKGWQVELSFPPGFALSREQFDAALKQHPTAKVAFLLDKGTLTDYDAYAARLPVYVVDHHGPPVNPEKVIFYNVNGPKKAYTMCSNSLLCHGIASLAGTRESFDDFLALLGLKGDWAIEPVTGFISDFVKPFFIEYGQQFKNLFLLVDERPTMFDASQRDHTCLLSRVSEFVHGTGGGGFQYFYHDRHESLRDVDHAACIGKALEALAGQVPALEKITTLESFVKLLPQPEQKLLDRIFRCFLEDWTRAEKLLDSSTRVLSLEQTGIYLFVGGPVPLLPMIGSIKLFDLAKAAGDKLAQIIMVSAAKSDYTHVSVRGSGDRVGTGKFCNQLQNALRARFEKVKDKISGGGHPRAGECTIRAEHPRFIEVLEMVTTQLNEMAALDAQSHKGKLSDKQRQRAEELGLEYLKA